MQVEYKNGIYLPELELWMDPHHTRASAFVTHAHSDHMRPHGKVYATPGTSLVMRARGAPRTQYTELAFGEPHNWGESQVTLYPAGHILGSAQVLVERAGTRLLYSGDFKLRAGLAAEPTQVPQADIVIMETTFGRPRYHFPAAELVRAEMVQWCHQVMHEGGTPVLLCYSLGKGQEVLAGLADCGLPIYLHAAHHKMTALYERLGQSFPAYQLMPEGAAVEGIVLCGPQNCRQSWYGGLRQPRTAYISGWALDGPWRMKTDAAFALSDHADYPELLEYVRLTGARKIYTQHGFDKLFAADLRKLGYDAWPLHTARPAGGQLQLF